MPTHYAIRAADPAAHLFHVVCRVDRPDPAGQRFMLPAWIPGSYMIREFARNIVRITALSGGRRLAPAPGAYAGLAGALTLASCGAGLYGGGYPAAENPR